MAHPVPAPSEVIELTVKSVVKGSPANADVGWRDDVRGSGRTPHLMVCIRRT